MKCDTAQWMFTTQEVTLSCTLHHRTGNYGWPHMTPTKYTQQRTVWDYSVSVCVQYTLAWGWLCLHLWSSPSPHCDKGRNCVALCTEGLWEHTSVCVSLVGSLWGITESSTWMNLYLWLVSTGLCTYSHPQTTFSISLCSSSFPGATTESHMNPRGYNSGEKTKGVRERGKEGKR